MFYDKFNYFLLKYKLLILIVVPIIIIGIILLIYLDISGVEKSTKKEPLLESQKEIFTLKVSGDSMINVGIHDGDIVIVQRQNTDHNGDIVVAMTQENEVTLKTFYKESNYFRLQPQNDRLQPIILSDVTILGKAIGLYRKI
jgi:repressor LexA